MGVARPTHSCCSLTVGSSSNDSARAYANNNDGSGTFGVARFVANGTADYVFDVAAVGVTASNNADTR